MPDSHCQLLTAPEHEVNTFKEHTSLPDVWVREGEEVVTDTLMCQRHDKGMNRWPWPPYLLPELSAILSIQQKAAGVLLWI